MEGFKSLLVLALLYIHIQPLVCESSTVDPVIKKCLCGGDEVQTIKGCLISTKHLPIYIYDDKKNTTNVIDLRTSNETLIQSVQCSSNATKDVLFDLPFISPRGTLLLPPYSETDQYCVENVENEAGEIFIRVEKCEEKFPIRLCCQTNEYLDSSERCTQIPNKKIEDFVLKWIHIFNYKTERTQCKGGDIGHDRLSYEIPIHEMRSIFQHFDQMTDKHFCVGMYGDENEIYPGVTFCQSHKKKQEMVPTIPTCCQQNRAFDLQQLQCVPHQEIFTLPENIQWPPQGANQQVSLPTCDHVGLLSLSQNASHAFMLNGTLQSETGYTISFSRYCLGAIITNKSTVSHSGLWCLVEEEAIPCPWRWHIHTACHVISCIFLLATLAVYLGIPDLRRRIGGVCLISELVALLVSQITLIILQNNRRNFTPSGCLAAGIIELIFILASFFWLNIMCFDVWSTFRVLRPFSEKVFRIKVFMKYSLYGWGIPLIIGIWAIVMEKLDVKIKPNFTPETSCFFSDYDLWLHWIYMYGFILIVLLVNAGLFIHLAFTLISNYKEKKKSFKSCSDSNVSKQTNQNVENMKLHLKLFIIMGIPWLIEVFTSFASKETLCYIWFLDLLNMLRGVIIFVIFVCKKSARDKIIANWFPSHKPKLETSGPSRKTSTMSLSSWLPSFHGRKISKVSMTSAGHINLEALKEEKEEARKTTIQEEMEEEYEEAPSENTEQEGSFIKEENKQ